MPAIGDKVIYVPKNNSRPVVTVIARLTPTGQIGLAETKGSFRKAAYADKDRYGQGSWKDAVYLFSDDRLARLNTAADLKQKDEREKAAERDRVASERKARDETQAATIREVCDNKLPIQSRQDLPDSNRLYILSLPINPDHADKLFDVLIVRVRDKEDYDWGKSTTAIKPVGDSTYMTARRSGFSGYSSVRGDTDEEILWTLVQARYFDWN